MSHQFVLTHLEEISDIHATVRIYSHPSGAQLVSIHNDDENKCFGVSFRTLPANSNGVAHILEHSVLCGSKHFPVKSPFNELLKGSLNTFLNAMTYPDKTIYPVASTNLKDLYNLVDVYMDAVFHPLISEDTLRQEGWRYEFDEAGKLTYKGIVYNEMKGASATAERVLGKALSRELFPDTIYANDSGGDPRVIPTLSYAEFTDFHATYYHPSNSLLYWYGDDEIETRLERLEPYLANFSAQTPPPPIAKQSKWSASRTAKYMYPATADEQRHHVLLAWMIDKHFDDVDEMEIMIVDHVLLNDAVAPLRKSLLDSDLGEDLSGGGFGNNLQTYFALGLKGVAPENVAQIAPLVRDSITKIITDGVDPAQIQASINTIEFDLRERNTGGFPRGLALMIGLTNPWLYGQDIIKALRYESALTSAKQRLQDPQRIGQLLQTLLLDNPHMLELIVAPDATLNDRLDAQEAAELVAAEATLTSAQRDEINAAAQRLTHWQETPDSPEALATIPRLTRDDLEPHVKVTPLVHERIGDIPVTIAPLFTSGIMYVDIGFDLRNLPADLIPYLPLFVDALTETGAGDYDAVRLSQRIGTYTGGVSATSMAGTNRLSKDYYALLLIRGKATSENIGTLLDIMRDVSVAAHLDNRERILQLIKEDKASREARVLPSGHALINSRLRARFGNIQSFNELLGGVSYLKFIRELAATADSQWEAIHAKLAAIRTALINQASMRFHVTCNPELVPSALSEFNRISGQIPSHTVSPQLWSTLTFPSNEALIAPAQVNYVGVAAQLSQVGYTCSGTDIVVNRHLSRTFLHEQIREKGGAYGAFSVLDIRSGILSMLSYRDPNISKTLDVYAQAGQWLTQVQLDDDALLQAIIGAAGDLDGYQLPDARGFTAFIRHLSGDDDAYRQQTREQALAVTIPDFVRYGEALLALNAHWQRVVLGGDASIQQAVASDAGLFTTLTNVI